MKYLITITLLLIVLIAGAPTAHANCQIQTIFVNGQMIVLQVCTLPNGQTVIIR